jgi:hypothetical protein
MEVDEVEDLLEEGRELGAELIEIYERGRALARAPRCPHCRRPVVGRIVRNCYHPECWMAQRREDMKRGVFRE